MSFQPLNRVLETLQPRLQRREASQMQIILDYWPKIVGATVSAQTQPLSLQRHVLRVATASSAWAQTLTFERQRILEKLNQVLPKPLTDIRFAPADWQASPVSRSPVPGVEAQVMLWQQHPSRLPELPLRKPTKPVTTPQEAFRSWSKQVRSRAQSFPYCPTCQCPTPPGELERWGFCAICTAKQWNQT